MGVTVLVVKISVLKAQFMCIANQAGIPEGGLPYETDGDARRLA